MTIDRDGTGTARYVAPRAGATPDVFGLANPALPEMQPWAPPPLDFEWLPETATKRSIGWRLTVYDLSGGVNMTRGWLHQGHYRTKNGTLDMRMPGFAVLPRKVTSAATPAPQNLLLGQMFAVNVFGTLAIALQGDGDVQLVKETSSSDPTLVDTGYSAGADDSLLGIWPVILNSASSPQLAVGRDDGGVQILSDLAIDSPTVAGTMHSDTADCYGIIQTALPDAPILIASGGKLRTLNSSDAISTQPTEVLDNVPTLNSSAIGLAALGGGPLRAYWVWRRRAADYFSRDGKIVSTNQRGTDPQEMILPLKTVYSALKVRDGIVAGDGRRIIHTNGRLIKDLGVMRDRDRDSDYTIVPISIGVVENEELYCQISRTSSGGSDVWFEQYMWDRDAWLPVTKRISLGGGGAFLNRYAFEGLAYSDATNYMHTWMRSLSGSGSWFNFKLPAPGQNPFYRRQTSGGVDTASDEFEESAYWESPDLLFPSPVTYAPKVIDRMYFGGDLDAGGTGATFKLTAGGVDWTWKQPLKDMSRVHEFRGNQHRFRELSIRADAARGTDTNFTPQILPFTIEGRVFLDEVKKLPWLPWG